MRKTLFKWHSYLALIAMIPVLVISITGSILVFKVEIDSLLRPHHMVVNPTITDTSQTTQRLALDDLMSRIQATYPDYILSGWELFGTDDNAVIEEHGRSDTAYAIKKNTETWFKIYINQYTGEILSEPKHMEHYITDWLLELHYAFLLHFSGTVIGAIFGLILLFLGISGIILYRKFWRKLFTLRWGSAKRILFSDVHKMVGIFSSPVLIIIAFTGVYWNISIVLHEVLEHGFEEAHPAITEPYHAETISFESLRENASMQIDSFRATYLAIPNEPKMDITFFGEVDTPNPLISQYASMVTYHHKTGDLVMASDIRDTGFLRKFDDSTRKLHFGYFAGIWSKIVWCIIGISPVILMITGLIMYLIRRQPKRKAR
ncbi:MULTISPECIES: PepSY-associated TM helix domain-containing protein [Alteromonadaceae]|uniref:PepSY-associated TM helix domain-containing protein n=1 Tax=Brumicola blandensis TaxID=3075611 RepID=A0AAW8R3I7_9ALTE|nr:MULTISPECIES: PepSY-associated TM helix domain-containing protein [unclassified Alteromonas]MDT0583599.1 PepSY-associated TM helix domain-containing protein [Alteromonas sp. W409]MDT0629276.1 PepSY-associated TM helix domain-containing protein [Alteromonas sp. W364]